MAYAFGLEDKITFGYDHAIIENEDIRLDDNTSQGPFASLEYWFNNRNGIMLDYSSIIAYFSRDDNSPAGEDYVGHTVGTQYRYRFAPQTTGSVSYTFNSRSFSGDDEDYNVHGASLGLNHSLSSETTMDVNGGFYRQDNQRSKDEDGYTYAASFIRRFQRGSYTLSALGGWDEGYQAAERRSFTRFWGVNTGMQYQLTQSLSNNLNASYRLNRDSDNMEWETLSGSYGIQWTFLRWCSISLDYSYRERNSDIDTDDYRDNRVMLRITANRLFGW